MQDLDRIFLLKTGKWDPDHVIVHQITDRTSIDLCPGDKEAIESKWYDFLARQPSAFKGSTIRLVGWHEVDDRLTLEVIPSNYKEACLLGFLGVAMVPVIGDSCIVLQGPSKKSTSFGAALRPPGCTPENTDVLPQVIKEMHEEFGILVKKEDMQVLGLVQAQAGAAPLPNCSLVVRVKCHDSFSSVQKKWRDAKDKTEGRPVKLQVDPQKGTANLRGKGQKVSYSTCLILLMVIDSILRDNGRQGFISHKWCDEITRLKGLEPKNWKEIDKSGSDAPRQ